MRALLLGACSAFATLLLPVTATAQDVQNFVPAVGTWNYFSQEGVGTAERFDFVPSLYVGYAATPLVLRDADDEVTDRLVEHLLTFDLLGTVGLHERIELGAHLPLHIAGGDDTTTFAPGDLRLIPKVRLLGGSERAARGFALAVAVPLALPTGDEGAFVGENGFSAQPKLIGELALAGLRLAANIGALLRTDEAQLADLTVGHELTYGAGAALELGSEDLLGVGEVYGAAPIAEAAAGDNAPLEGVAGLRYFAASGAVLSGGLGTGFVTGYGAPAFRIFVGVAWDPRPEPEPEPLPEPGPTDRDGDGLLDADDGCPDAPEDRDGFQDEDGCPDPDNDNDGILDEADGCPTVPEDKDDFEDHNGCPDPDNDNDGLPDVRDKCPNVPETINGLDDEDGCPDQGRVRVTEAKIEILDRVHFETNKAVIRRGSYTILDQVISVLKGHPEIRSIRVEGHTDSVGSAKHNRRLSQARAEAVRTYLVEHGVAPARLEARGYGEDRPIARNRSREGRAENRRVEFVILERR